MAKAELAALEGSRTVLSTKLFAGRTVARVLAEEAPGAGWEPAAPELEDVYFGALGGHLAGTAGRSAASLPEAG